MPLADLNAAVSRSMRAWKPPERLSLSEWADRHFVLSAETAAEPGRWHTLPYQRGIMDAITDPSVEKVSVMKSARIGYTLMVSSAIGYFMHHEPSSMLMVQPIVDDAKNFSKETIAPMLRDVPVLAKLRVQDEAAGPRDSSNTLQHKKFPGGVLSLAGANSGAGFRRISRRVVIFDEVDAYPPSAGSDGDPIRLGEKRSQTFWNRKIIVGSTPLLAGASRIEQLFDEGDRRRFHVPCPTCGRMDFLTFRKDADRGHWMEWDEGKPETAHFICRGCGVVIEHKSKRWMVERGEWRGEAPFKGHASFHVWAAYSYSPNATWAHIAAEFLASKGNPLTLQTFVNTVLGETWIEKGEAPDWQRLYLRRETYQRATVPADVLFITAGVDVQRDRLVWEVVGWGDDKQSWSIDAGVFPGDTSKEGPDGPWAKLDELLSGIWPKPDGTTLPIHTLAIDSGDQTQTVYNWARRYPMSRVIACKGSATARVIIGSPSAVDVKVNGKRIARGYKVWTVGSDIAKGEFYGFLRLDPPTKESGDPYPPGYCHHPEYGEDYFKQITAEHLVRVVKRTGFVRYEWQVLPGRENHWLDCRVYARAAAALAGLDRHAARKATAPAPAPTPKAPAPESAPAQTPQAPRPEPRRSGWLGGRSGGTWKGGGWIRRR